MSEATGTSPRSLRYYEELGLIRAPRRPNGYRDYGPSAVADVLTIRSLLDLGFPTALVERILPCTGDAGPVGDCSALVEHATEIRGEIDQKIRRLSETSEALTRFVAQA
ncbi:MerR family transcriptional regulator [Cryptosporangium sp. NPDC048952]|uniref:MerR family transcriptional regulator n=1 Tax=Cryptosporangium sp. NPDC048952 TaxID=3363961 RepID=UPI0037246F7B